MTISPAQNSRTVAATTPKAPASMKAGEPEIYPERIVITAAGQVLCEHARVHEAESHFAKGHNLE